MSLGSLDQPFKWQWDGEYGASFTVVPRSPPVLVFINRWPESPAAQRIFNLVDSSGFDVVFSVEDRSYKAMSGYGHAGRVLATVAAIVSVRLESHTPAVVEAVTGDDKLARAYTRLLKRVRHPRYTAWGGYIEGGHYFALIRDQAPDYTPKAHLERL